MRTKHDRKDLEKILRKRGSQQTPDVRPAVTEIRSCGVMGYPEPVPPGGGEFLGGLVIMWEFSVQFDKLKGFHEFLATTEHDMVVQTQTRDPGARYLGTYMMHAGGTPRYRTVWAYASLEVMLALWAKEVEVNGPLAAAAKRLRAYWVKDPNRSEARWVPARLTLTKKDAFAALTMDALDVAI